MRVEHAQQDDWIDTGEVDAVQASDVVGMEHVVLPGERRTAGETLSALRAVWEDTEGRVWALDFQDAGHTLLYAGVTRTAAVAGQTIDVQHTGVLDAFEVEGLGLVPGPVWLGVQGALTQTAPVTGVDRLLGALLADTRLLLCPADPIFLE
jgi:hypothetical protein